MIEPLQIEFSVPCSPEHAFDTWTRDISSWWPHTHSFSGDEGLTVTFEPRIGGRIYERTPAGVEHDWGEVVEWEPPHRLTYLWHIYGPREQATEVEVTFASMSDSTFVTIVHRGWERLGEAGPDLRSRNQHGWDGVIPYFDGQLRKEK